jgi:zinc transport system permease protein
MIDAWYRALDLLPGDWAQFQFMKLALLAVLLAAPTFGLLSTLVVSNRMAFFSEVMGHSALTGIALGVLIGSRDPLLSMVVFCVLLAAAISVTRGATHASPDTVLGVFMAATVALGIVILSRGGGFSRYTDYLIGDILTVNKPQIELLAALLVVVVIFWAFAGNALTLISLNPAVARSRGLRVGWYEAAFAVLLALVVALSIRMVGLLVLNSLVVLPAAAARNVSRNLRAYTALSVMFSVSSAVLGLIASFYAGTASGATIVIVAAVLYGATVMWAFARRAPYGAPCVKE